MIPYILLFSIPAIFTIGSGPGAGRSIQDRQFLSAYSFLIAFMIGFRTHVGGDWSWDIRRIITHSGAGIDEFATITDSGYGVLMWITSISGWNVWVNHLIGGAIFAYGLKQFCLRQPYPWLAMTIAIPYLVIVVAMGYDRQAVAIGLLMLGIVALESRSLSNFIASMALATSMHATALSFLPVFVFASKLNKYITIAVVAPVFVAGYYIVLRDKADTSIVGYIGTRYSSSGAAIRIAMNAIPAAIYYMARGKFVLRDDQRRFADVICAVALLFVVALLASPSSTAVDRMALYVIPVQILVFSRLPAALSRSIEAQKFVALGVVVYSFTVMIVWLAFADNASSWVPYRLMDIDEAMSLVF